MNIDKYANLGTGNIIQEINIQNVEHFYPNAHTVINNGKSGPQELKGDAKAAKPARRSPMEQRDLPPVREQIMLYVSCLNVEKFVQPEWVGKRYMDLWNGILDIPKVEALVYNPGKQRETSFNRNLVGNIIYYLATRPDKRKCVYKDFNASLFADKLETNPEHSVRLAMGKLPTDEVKLALDRYMEDFIL